MYVEKLIKRERARAHVVEKVEIGGAPRTEQRTVFLEGIEYIEGLE